MHKLLLKMIKSEKLFAILCFILFSVIFHSWIYPKGVISHGDFIYYYSTVAVSWFKTLVFIWPSYDTMGYNNLAGINLFIYNYILGFVTNLRIDYGTASRIVILTPFVLISFWSTFLLIRYLTKNIRLASVAPFIFVFNPASIVLIKWPRLGLAYALIPLAVLLTIKVLRERRIYLIFLLILTFLGMFTEGRILLFAIFICGMEVLFFWLFKLRSRKELLKQLFVVVFFLGTIVLLSSFALLPAVLKESKDIFTAIASRDLIGIDYYTLQKSFTLYHPFWTGVTIEPFIDHPTPIYFWLFPLIAFSSLFYSKRNYQIPLISLIALISIFIGKGASSPFGDIYIWLYQHVFFFSFIRDSSRWWAITVVSYTILISYFFAYSTNFFKEKISKHKAGLYILNPKAYITATSLGFLTLIIGLTAKPIFTGETGWVFSPKFIPSDYISFKELISTDKNYYRTLHVPDMQLFTYLDVTHPAVRFMDLDDSIKTLNPKFLSLASFKYVVLPEDMATNKVYEPFGTREAFANYVIDSANASSVPKGYFPLKRIDDIGGISVWQNFNLTPHIMPVNNLIYVQGNNSLKDNINLPTSQRVAYYLQGNSSDGDTKQLSISSSDLEVQSMATEIYYTAQCIRCNIREAENAHAELPFVRFLPDSPLYPIIEWKDNKTISGKISNEQLFSSLINLSKKRMSEIQQMLLRRTDNLYIKRTIVANDKFLDNIKALVATVARPSNNQLLLDGYNSLLAEKRVLNDNMKLVQNSDNTYAIQDMSDRLDNTTNIIWSKMWITKDNDKKLIVDIPREDNYHLVILNDPNIDIANSVLYINGLVYEQKQITNEYIDYGFVHITEGEKRIEFKLVPKNLFSDATSVYTIATNGSLLAKEKILAQGIDDPHSTYQFKAEYRVTEGDSPRIFISSDVDRSNLYGGVIDHVFDQKLDSIPTDKWQTFQTFFTSRYGTKNSYLNVWLSGGPSASTAEISNIRLNKVIVPNILFIKENQLQLQTPKIEFQEINPSDYRIHINDATSPFFLAFSETFDPGWKIYFSDNLALDKKYPVVANYFNNNVQEREYIGNAGISTFIGSLSRQELDSTHVPIDGFGNGWIINKKGTYTIDIIFNPQRYFLIGLFISAIVLGLVILMFFYFYVKDLKIRNKTLYED